MANITQLFKIRHQSYTDHTHTIFQSLHHNVLQSIEECLSDAAGDQNDRNIIWDTVHLLEGFLVITGTVLLEPGSVVRGEGGEDLKVTINNQEYFKDTVKLNFPIELVDKGNKTDIVEYLKELFDNTDPNKDASIFNSWQAKFKTVEPVLDFDYTILSLDQLKRLKNNDDGSIN
jgi:hypothetical protein